MAVTIYRQIRADSPTLYRNIIREFSGHLDALFVQIPGRLIAAENKVQLFRVARS
jgi:hypothetical protein